MTKITFGKVQLTQQFAVSVFGTAIMVCDPGSMKWSSVRLSLSVCLSIRLSHHSIAAVACGGFAAERQCSQGWAPGVQ